MKTLRNILITLTFLSAISCTEKFLDFTPDGGIAEDEIFTTFKTAESALIGTYSSLSGPYFSATYEPIISELMGEDVLLLEGANLNANYFVDVYKFSLLPNYTWVEEPWAAAYSVVYSANKIIQGVDEISDADEADVKRLVAEAKALRAYCFLQLAHMYCDAYHLDPQGAGLMLPLNPAGLKEADEPRSTLYDTYDRIERDLLAAETIYEDIDSVELITDQGRMNVKAVQAMLARTYLDMENWEDARDYAVKAYTHEDIELYPTSTAVNEAINGYGNAFLNSETLFAIDLTVETGNTINSMGSFYSPNSGYASIRASEAFYDLFEKSDFRYDYFLKKGSTYYDDYTEHFKIEDSTTVMILKFGDYYSIGTADRVCIRASEMYLIEAECEVMLTHDEEAQIALSKIQTNAYGSTQKVTKTGDALLEEILLERRKELFGEGFRLSDIKRRQQKVVRNKIDGHWVDFSYEPGDEEYFRFVLPIPQSELDANKETSSDDQNFGY